VDHVVVGHVVVGHVVVGHSASRQLPSAGSVTARSVALIEPGEGKCRAPEEARRRVAVATCRRTHEAPAAGINPGDQQGN
jgi:hypothetical protein